MGKLSKAQKVKNLKIVCAITVSFILLFSLMVSTVSATSTAAIQYGNYETTANATSPSAVPAPTERPLIETAVDYADNATDANLDEKMKKALTAVKEVVEIDDKVYTSFNYNYNPGDGKNNFESWYFTWNSADGKSSIYAGVSGADSLINYGKYEYTDDYNSKHVKLAEISKAAAKTKADAFLKKIFGEEFGGYRAYYQNLTYPSDRYTFSYVLTKNKYDYANYTLYIEVDKFNGEILSFSRNDYPQYNSDANSFNFQSADKIISKEDALKSCLDKIGVELVYMSNFDYATKKLSINPVYRLKSSYDQYISAVDGSLVKIANDNYGPAPAAINARNGGMMYDMAVAEQSAMGGGGISFSQVELSEMAKTKDYITSDEALDIIIKTFDLKLGDMSGYQKNINLQVDYINQEQYYWSISLYRDTDGKSESYNASVDARNGNIISYSTYSYSPYDYYDYNGDGISDNPLSKDTAPKYLYNYDEAKKVVLEKIKEISPYDIDKNFELVESGVNTDKSSYYNFYFVRKVNGIKFESNSISVSFDNISGKINSYYSTWYEKAEFPKLDKIISAEKALNAIDAYDNYKINYVSNGVDKNGKINAVLVYRFDNPPMVDPFTGKCIGWDFKELTANSTEPNYKDIEGNPQEKVINTLTDNGIYAWGGEKFEPDKGITKGELLNYLKFYIYNSYYFTSMNSSLFVKQFQYNQNDSFLTSDLDKVLTKQEAAQIICYIAGYGDLGMHSEIFVYPFNGGKVDEAYKGYLAILKTFGIISGDEEGRYEASETLTRAEAAEFVYNIIMSLTAAKG